MTLSSWATIPSTLPSACSAQTSAQANADQITKTTYDAAGAVLKLTRGVGVSGLTPIDDRVNVYSSAYGTLTSAADGKGNLTTYEYDAFNRLVKTRYPNASGGGSSTGDFEEVTYTGSRVTNARRRDGRSISTTYDALGRVATRGTSVTETFAYNNLGAVTQRTRADVGSGATWTANFSYNSLGWLLGETTLRGTTDLGAVTYGYDAYGRRTSLTWPDSFAVAYEYDVTGALTAIKQSGADIVTFAYDNMGRRTGLSRPISGTPTQYASYTYDGASRLTGLGLDLASTAADQTWGFTFHPSGQIKARTATNPLYQWTAPSYATQTAAYDGLNRDAAVAAVGDGACRTPSGGGSGGYDCNGNLRTDGVRSFVHDVENRLTSATSSGQSLMLAYDVGGRLSETTHNSTVTTERGPCEGSQRVGSGQRLASATPASRPPR